MSINGRRAFQRLSLTLAVAVAGYGLLGSAAGGFCDATGRGSSAQDAIASNVRACGSNYSVEKGPLDADKPTTVYVSYAHVVEYGLNVQNNSEGTLAFVMVGQRTPRAVWRTLGQPGTGP